MVDVDAHGQLPTGDALDRLPQRLGQADLVDRGRSQPFHEASHVDDGVPDVVAQSLQVPSGGRGVRVE